MYQNSPDSDLPVGFTSFCNDISMTAGANLSAQIAAADLSFAEKDKDDVDHSFMHLQSGKEQLDSDFEDEFTKKRDAKLCKKKSDLYMKIMKEHGFTTEEVIQKTSSQSKLSYVIPTLNKEPA